MLFENAFKCTYSDCAFPVIVTFFITLLLMIILHVYLYYRSARIAKKVYGSAPLPQFKDIDKLN